MSDPSPDLSPDPNPASSPDAPGAQTSSPPASPPPRRAWLRRLAWVGGGAGLGILALSGGFALATRGAPRATLTPFELTPPEAAPERQTLRLISFNLAHGRAESFHQGALTRAEIEANLDAVGALLRREQPQVVALQEADGPSWWSGRFDHVEHLARRGELALALRCANVEGLGLSYGTALLSDLPCLEAEGYTFAASPPTLSKGFLRATLLLGRREIDVVSLHLDFSRQSVRERQLATLAEALRPRVRPCVVVGDFNCGWSKLAPWAAALELEAFRPEAALVTFPGHSRRLDWVLISPEFERVDERILPERLSDHLAIVTDLRLR